MLECQPGWSVLHLLQEYRNSRFDAQCRGVRHFGLEIESPPWHREILLVLQPNPADETFSFKDKRFQGSGSYLEQSWTESVSYPSFSVPVSYHILCIPDLSKDMNWNSVNGLMDQVPRQYATVPSPSGRSDSESTAMYYMENDSLSGAENDAPSPQRRRKARMNEVDEETQLRRRAQNRDSQQAYRQRREEYIQGLQGQIVDLHLRHRDLWQSYLSQGRRVGLLREVAADLGSEIATLRQRQGQESPLASDRMVISQGDQGYVLAAGCSYDPRSTTLCTNMNSATIENTAPGNGSMGTGRSLQLPNVARSERKLH